KWEDAKRVLDQRRGRVATGDPLPPRVDRVTYDEAAADLVRHYATTQTRTLADVRRRLVPLTAFFRGVRLVAIGPRLVTEYVAHRQAPRPPARAGGSLRPGVRNGTINRELSILGTLCRLAVDNGRALRVPKIPKLREADPRAGFVDPDRFA